MACVHAADLEFKLGDRRLDQLGRAAGKLGVHGGLARRHRRRGGRASEIFSFSRRQAEDMTAPETFTELQRNP